MAIHETVYINLFLIFRYLSYLDGLICVCNSIIKSDFKSDKGKK